MILRQTKIKGVSYEIQMYHPFLKTKVNSCYDYPMGNICSEGDDIKWKIPFIPTPIHGKYINLEEKIVTMTYDPYQGYLRHILFDCECWILIEQSDLSSTIYQKINNHLSYRWSFDTAHVWIDEKKMYLINLTKYRKITYVTMNNFDIKILNEKFIAFNRNKNNIRENKYLISESNNTIILRLNYFHTCWKIFEITTTDLLGGIR